MKLRDSRTRGGNNRDAGGMSANEKGRKGPVRPPIKISQLVYLILQFLICRPGWDRFPRVSLGGGCN